MNPVTRDSSGPRGARVTRGAWRARLRNTGHSPDRNDELKEIPMTRLSLGPRILSWTILIAATGFLAARRPQSPPVSPEPANRGIRITVPFETVRASFQDPDMIYAPFIFWFWDEPLDAAKMADMSRVMASQRFSPGYAHARRSMVGTPDLPDAEWLGDKWFASFDAAMKEAEA